jgi:hypothetical protein
MELAQDRVEWWALVLAVLENSILYGNVMLSLLKPSFQCSPDGVLVAGHKPIATYRQKSQSLGYDHRPACAS